MSLLKSAYITGSKAEFTIGKSKAGLLSPYNASSSWLVEKYVVPTTRKIKDGSHNTAKVATTARHTFNMRMSASLEGGFISGN